MYRIIYLILSHNKPVIFKLDNYLLDLEATQHESLLQPHHARYFGVVADDGARLHIGKDGDPCGQCLKISTETFPLHFDRWKCFFHIKKKT